MTPLLSSPRRKTASLPRRRQRKRLRSPPLRLRSASSSPTIIMSNFILLSSGLLSMIGPIMLMLMSSPFFHGISVAAAANVIPSNKLQMNARTSFQSSHYHRSLQEGGDEDEFRMVEDGRLIDGDGQDLMEQTIAEKEREGKEKEKGDDEIPLLVDVGVNFEAPAETTAADTKNAAVNDNEDEYAESNKVLDDDVELKAELLEDEEEDVEMELEDEEAEEEGEDSELLFEAEVDDVAVDMGDGDVASDSAETEETDVHEAADELLKEAEEEGKQPVPAPAPAPVTSEPKEEVTQLTSAASTALYPESHKSAWVAHGAVGAVVFGLLVPMAISSAFFRDSIPTYWIYIHVCINVITFAMTFFTVGIAFATMNGMGVAGEGHFKEMHHIVGLMLLMLVSFQTANGFLRPPREFVTDDEHGTTPGAVLRSRFNDKSMTTRTLWHLVHSLSGLVIFALGAYQVQSGLGLFAKRFDTPDWGQVYIGYIGWLVAVIIAAKLWMKWKERKNKMNNMELQMGRGGAVSGVGSNLGYDPENDFAMAQFETV